MKTKKYRIFVGAIALAVCGSVVVVAGLHGGEYAGTNASALSYSTTTDVSFTFAPTLSISLSDTDLVIDNMVPGQTSTSNVITIIVGSNTPYGYSLYADAGSNNTSSTYYNTSSLVHSDSTVNNVFASIATNASLTSLTTDNTWGYSTSTDNGTTWSAYNGLPTATSTSGSSSTDSPTLLIDTKDPADSSRSIDFKVAARASTTQASGTYSNIINFYAVGKPYTPPTLYEEVAKMSKGTQTTTDLQTTITTPTSTDYREDVSNSGVYKYNATAFGTSSDASNDYDIYYYRGILEPTEENGTQGSDGSASTYPNYVRLGNNTCWRIVRTTGSGGVKMIYNGVWDTTNNTCANATNKAQVTTSAFNSSYNNAIYVGYTYNNAMIGNTDTSTSVDTVFGSNADTTLNNTRSTIKTYIEDTWYTNKMMTGSTDNYVSLLEPSAGYCNDRTVYNTSWTALTEIIPQQTVNIRFGAIRRVGNNGNKIPSLTCPRGDVDLYRYISTTSTTAFTSNELRHPAALLTADEVSLAGSGYNGMLPYNTKSFLNSGSHFWLLSPGARSSNGNAREFFLYSGGYLNDYYVDDGYGVRPAISLKPGTYVTSGNGTATSPWTVNE